MWVKQFLEASLLLILFMSSAFADIPANIIRIGAPISQGAIAGQDWSPADPSYSEWESGQPYNCSEWSPSSSGFESATVFMQYAVDCQVDRIRTRQEREFNAILGAYRDVGAPKYEKLTHGDQRAARYYRIQYSDWLNSGLAYNCKNWTPDANTVPQGVSFLQMANDCDQDQAQTRSEVSSFTGSAWMEEGSQSYFRTLTDQVMTRTASGSSIYPTITLNAPASVFVNEPFILNWKANNHNKVSIIADQAGSGLPGGGLIVSGDHYSVVPAASGKYTYTAFATNKADEQVDDSRSVIIMEHPSVSVFVSRAGGAGVEAGTMVEFEWSTANADTISINNGVGDVSNLSRTMINVGTSPGLKTYVLTASKTLNGITRSATKTASVTVKSAKTCSYVGPTNGASGYPTDGFTHVDNPDVQQSYIFFKNGGAVASTTGLNGNANYQGKILSKGVLRNTYTINLGSGKVWRSSSYELCQN